jgi:hypothetical protein
MLIARLRVIPRLWKGCSDGDGDGDGDDDEDGKGVNGFSETPPSSPCACSRSLEFGDLLLPVVRSKSLLSSCDLLRRFGPRVDSISCWPDSNAEEAVMGVLALSEGLWRFLSRPRVRRLGVCSYSRPAMLRAVANSVLSVSLSDIASAYLVERSGKVSRSIGVGGDVASGSRLLMR